MSFRRFDKSSARNRAGAQRTGASRSGASRSRSSVLRSSGGKAGSSGASKVMPFPAGGRRAASHRASAPAEQAVRPSSPDLLYALTLIALVSFGTIMVYSATALERGTAQLLRMAMWLALGAAGCLAGVYLPMRFWRKLSPWLLLGTLAALASLLVDSNPLALNVNGATRWFQLGSVTLQPSEIAKLAFILFAAGMLERRRDLKGEDWLVFLGVLGVFAFLIYKEPDLGTTLVLGGTAFCMLIAAEVDAKKLIALLVTAGVVVGAAAWTTPHQKKRLLTWANPWHEEYRYDGGLQTVMSQDAMARGGITGLGLGSSLAKMDNRVPEAETDFIFAVVGEELGLIGGMGLLLLFTLLAMRGYTIAVRAPDRYSALVAVGITSWVAVQSCLNVAVATGTAPNTGVPLPFISSGGSSLVTLMTAAGIVLGISRYRRQAGS